MGWTSHWAPLATGLLEKKRTKPPPGRAESQTSGGAHGCALKDSNCVQHKANGCKLSGNPFSEPESGQSTPPSPEFATDVNKERSQSSSQIRRRITAKFFFFKWWLRSKQKAIHTMHRTGHERGQVALIAVTQPRWSGETATLAGSRVTLARRKLTEPPGDTAPKQSLRQDDPSTPETANQCYLVSGR